MLRPVLVLLSAALFAGAQETPNVFTGAAPDIEKALRDRVAGYYQAYVDGKFRQAEQFIAEDTKDTFFNQEKHKIRGYEIVKINWDDSYKKASVVTLVQTNIVMRGQSIPANAPMATRWKLEDGKWCYYVDPSLGRETPVGIMKPGAGNRTGMKIDDILKDPGIILNQVKVNKDKFLVHSWEKSADTIVVTNGMSGSITLDFQTETIKGLTFKVEKKELGPGETSKIELIYDPENQAAKPTLKATLRIEPLAMAKIIPIVFDIPEEIKKQLPKK